MRKITQPKWSVRGFWSDWSERLAHYDPDAVFAEARQEKVCPFETQLELARHADAVVADYNYVFDPGAALGHLDREGLESAILLIDEAHNLADRARAIFSPELLEPAFRDVAGRLLLQSGKLFFGIDAHRRRRARVFAGNRFGAGHRGSRAAVAARCAICGRNGNRRSSAISPGNAKSTWPWRMIRLSICTLAGSVSCRFWICLVRVLRAFRKSALTGRGLALICLDPARAIAPIFRAAASSILFSATLSPVEITRRTLGLEKDRTARSRCRRRFRARTAK